MARTIDLKTFRFFDAGEGPTLSIVTESGDAFFLRLKAHHPDDVLAELATWVADQRRRRRTEGQSARHGAASPKNPTPL
jgi:hypothetical protein